jgi:hypothetical protein
VSEMAYSNERVIRESAEAVRDPATAVPASIRQFRKSLANRLGTDVQIVPGRLPGACASLWAGLVQADRIEFNPRWPAPVIELVAHAAGHLLLGHCGQVRDGGQFASLLGGAFDPVVRGRVQAVLPDPESAPERLFSDRDESQAEAFASRLLDRLGHARVLTAAVFTCIG